MFWYSLIASHVSSAKLKGFLIRIYVSRIKVKNPSIQRNKQECLRVQKSLLAYGKSETKSHPIDEN
mgnify:FL=1